MTDEPKNTSPKEAGEPSKPDGKEPHAANAPRATEDDKAPSSARAAEDAGSLPSPETESAPPTPESQAALTGKAPSGSSVAGTTVPAAEDAGDDATRAGEKWSSAPPGASKPAAAAPSPPANETPEEKKARLERIIAEAKAKKEAAARAESEAAQKEEPPGGRSPDVGDPLKTPSQADLEKAAKIAEAKARAAAMKEAAAAKAPAPSTAAAPGAPKAPVKKKDEGPKPEDASDDALVVRLRERFAGAVKEATTFLGQLSILVEPSSIVEVCRALRDDEETAFNYLSDVTCVHFPEREDAPFEVVYNLYSIERGERVRLKARVGEEEGVESVTSVWPAANWMEREVYDLFGVKFRNHPDLRRLLLPPDWEGHPLRKDFPLEFMENEWTVKHLPEFTEVEREQLEQRRAYGLEILSTPDERRIRELFRAGRDPLPKEHK